MGEEKTIKEKKVRGGVREGAGQFSKFKGETYLATFTIPVKYKEEIRKRIKLIVKEYEDK